MKQFKDERLHTEGKILCLLKRIKVGIEYITKKPVKGIPIIVIITLVGILVFQKNRELGIYYDDFDFILNRIIIFLLFFIMIVAVIIYLILIGLPIDAKSVSWNLQRIGLKNSIGEVPYLIKKTKEKEFFIYEFYAFGIPISTWEEKQSDIEAALNIKVVKIKLGKTHSQILLYGANYKSDLYDFQKWRDDFISDKDFELVLGSGLIGKEIVDLNIIPHILIGGSTGSGKSILLKNLLYQAKKKGAKVVISDFKGGVDFSSYWRKETKLITDMDHLIDELDYMVAELERRKNTLYETGTENIKKYNQINKPIERIIFACDEVAEILDKTGASKEYKEKIMQVESKLSTIARQGRAFGINLILATQRPDANILSGQIRNNIDCRICGRADDVLSKIILDNTDASELIPKDEQGLFLRNNGTVFKGYYFDK